MRRVATPPPRGSRLGSTLLTPRDAQLPLLTSRAARVPKKRKKKPRRRRATVMATATEQTWRRRRTIDKTDGAARNSE